MTAENRVNRGWKSGAVRQRRSPGAFVGVAAAICVAALSLLPAAAGAQEDGDVSPVTIGATYHAMAKNPADFALLRIGLEMQEAGRSRIEVIEELRRRRDARGALLGGEGVGRLADFSEEIGAAGGGAAGGLFGGWAGGVAGGVVGGAAGGVAGASLGDWLRESVRARQREAARSAQSGLLEAMYFSDEYRNLQEVFGNRDYWEPVWREVFEPQVGVSLDDGPIEAIAKVPELEADLRDHGVYDDLISVTEWVDGAGAEERELEDSEERFLSAFRSAADDFLESIDNSAEEWAVVLNERDERLAEVVREASAAAAAEERAAAVSAAVYTESWAEESRRRMARLRRARHEADRANFRSVAGLMFYGLAAVAPDTARGVAAFGQAVLDVGDAVNSFHGSIVVGASSALASAALTGNIVIAAHSLVRALSPGPTPEEVIIEQLQKLTEVVQKGFRNVHRHLDVVQREMHLRFDVVNSRFDLVERDLAQISRGIENVVSLMEEMREEIRRDFTIVRREMERANRLLDAVQDSVERIGDLVLGTYTRLSREHLEIRERIDALTVQDCPTADANLEGCLQAFYRLADGLTRQERETDDPRVLLADYTTFPGYMNNVGCREFAESTDEVVGCRDVVGAWQWLEVVREWTRFLNRHGSGLQVYAEQVQRVVDRLVDYQSAMATYRQSVVDDLRSFQEADDGEDGTAFSQIIGRAWKAHNELREMVRGLQQQYWNQREDGPEPGRPRLRRDGENNAIPELADRGPYSWRPMADFYSDDEVPEWVEIKRYSECEYDDMEDRYVELPPVGGAAKGPFWSRGPYFALQWSPEMPELAYDGILGLVHEGNLMPARLGMGTINVCARYARGETRTRLALQVWFEDRGMRRLEEAECTALLWSGIEEAEGEDQDASLLFWTAAVKSRRGPALIDAAATGEAMSECQKRYVRVVEAEQLEMWKYVADGLSGGRRPERTRIALDLSIASAHLRNWIDVAFNGVLGSALVEAFALGYLGFADLDNALRQAGTEPAGPVVEDVAHQIRSIENLLRSPAMRDLVVYGSGQPVFEETTVPGLPRGE